MNGQKFIMDVGPGQILVNPRGQAVNLLADPGRVAEAIQHIGEEAANMSKARSNADLNARLLRIYGWARELANEVGAPDQLAVTSMPYVYANNAGQLEFSMRYDSDRMEAKDFKIRG